MRTVFTSRYSFSDAEIKCRAAGFRKVGQAYNPKGFFVVFGERQDSFMRM